MKTFLDGLYLALLWFLALLIMGVAVTLAVAVLHGCNTDRPRMVSHE